MISVGRVNGSLWELEKVMLKLVLINVLLNEWEQGCWGVFNYSGIGMFAYIVFPLGSSASKPSVINKMRLSEGMV